MQEGCLCERKSAKVYVGTLVSLKRGCYVGVDVYLNVCVKAYEGTLGSIPKERVSYRCRWVP